MEKFSETKKAGRPPIYSTPQASVSLRVPYPLKNNYARLFKSIKALVGENVNALRVVRAVVSVLRESRVLSEGRADTDTAEAIIRAVRDAVETAEK